MNHGSIPEEVKGLKFSPKFPYRARSLSFSSKRGFFFGNKRRESEAETEAHPAPRPAMSPALVLLPMSSWERRERC